MSRRNETAKICLVALLLSAMASAQTVTHIIYIIKENRSLDSYFGAFPGYTPSGGSFQGVQSYCVGGTSPVFPNQAVCHYGNPANECSAYSGTCPEPITLSQFEGSPYSLYLEDATVNYHDVDHTHYELINYSDNGLQDRYSTQGCPNSGGSPISSPCGYAYFDSTQIGPSTTPGTYYYYATNYGLEDNFFATTTPSMPGHFYIFSGQNHGVADNPTTTEAGAKSCYPGATVNAGQSVAGVACSSSSQCLSNQCGCPASICTGNGGPGQWWESSWTCGAAHSGTSYPFTYTGTWSSAVGTPTSINTGVVNTSGTAVTWVSGSVFNLNWPGPIYIDNVAYTISSINSTTSITLTEPAGTQSAVTYTVNPMFCTTGRPSYTSAGTACSTDAQCTLSPYLYCTGGVYEGGTCSSNASQSCACFATAGNPGATVPSSCVDVPDCGSAAPACSAGPSIQGTPGAPCPSLTTLADQAQLASVSLKYYNSSGEWNPTTYVSNLFFSNWFAGNVFGENQFLTDAATLTHGVCSQHPGTSCSLDSTCSSRGHGTCVDPASSTLPQIVFIGAGEAQNPEGSEHPSKGPVSTGMQWTAAQIAAVVGDCKADNLSNNKCYLWNHSIIFVTWDDSGGFWDHVPQPMVDGLNLGNRVPLLAVSPFAVNGITHLQMEASSVLRCMEQIFSITPIGSRDTIANDACFGTGTMANPGTGPNAGMINLSQTMLNPPASPAPATSHPNKKSQPNKGTR
jgi:phospholipase C